MPEQPKKILSIFGTRPEVIKLAPVITVLEAHKDAFTAVNVASGQHVDLFYPFVYLFGIRIDHDLKIMQNGQTPSHVCSCLLAALEPILAQERPDLILVQGDTTTAMAGALAGFYQRIPVGHVEAGMRSGNVLSPFPEEINRQLIARLATYHFASTPYNRSCLLSEGVSPKQIYLTGNPVVDSLHRLMEHSTASPAAARLLEATAQFRRIVLTTHRRESFGNAIQQNLRILRSFVGRHQDVALIFPVHPNPEVRGPAAAILSGHPRIHLTEPLSYSDFIFVVSKAWLIVSDSGGVQAEAPSLGKPLLVLRENTEMPEVVELGIARLVGRDPHRLAGMLEDVYAHDDWVKHVEKIQNPLGRGDSGSQIVKILAEKLGVDGQTNESESRTRFRVAQAGMGF